MADWVRMYGARRGWGVRLSRGDKMKSLPDDLRMAGVPYEGALHPFEFRDGSFWHNEWAQKHPLYWHEKTQTQMLPGDYLVEDADGGVSMVRGYRPDHVTPITEYPFAAEVA